MTVSNIYGFLKASIQLECIEPLTSDPNLKYYSTEEYTTTDASLKSMWYQKTEAECSACFLNPTNFSFVSHSFPKLMQHWKKTLSTIQWDILFLLVIPAFKRGCSSLLPSQRPSFPVSFHPSSIPAPFQASPHQRLSASFAPATAYATVSE
jgi:hypothetical protein